LAPGIDDSTAPIAAKCQFWIVLLLNWRAFGRGMIVAGGLISYGPSLRDVFRQIGI
jgi:hypothetical protein